MIKGIDNTVKLYQMKPAHAKGNIITDTSGKKYIDMLAGVAVNLLGYNDAKINSAIFRQVK
ncbi:MAG TPA: aminotransferase class III-fold pyridoxal phosphate-dependent enzyme, partial [Candidatus Goldiibacteriota bacterium]|nr:aminotransferase class III-fold pyridoxal phosphate-dependent enzyme [Candidatus Goldiibacteriota bacterium]